MKGLEKIVCQIVIDQQVICTVYVAVKTNRQDGFSEEKYNQNWLKVRSLQTHDPKLLKAELAT